jgi:hypothetical protein|tara:strand:+ start:2311 stop:2568 length:258 start_codon:yes stop_codon:yes gene_type:complete
MAQHKNHKQNPEILSPEIQVGDLVRVREPSWLRQEVGVVTEIKDLVHEQTGTGYTAITTMMGDKFHTFSSKDFELVSKVERKEID